MHHSFSRHPEAIFLNGLQPVTYRVHLIVNGEERLADRVQLQNCNLLPLKTALIPIGKSPEVHVNAERWDQSESKHTTTAKAPSARTVLEEVFELLEDYAPIWYTQEQHDRILAALRSRDE